MEAAMLFYQWQAVYADNFTPRKYGSKILSRNLIRSVIVNW